MLIGISLGPLFVPNAALQMFVFYAMKNVDRHTHERHQSKRGIMEAIIISKHDWETEFERLRTNLKLSALAKTHGFDEHKAQELFRIFNYHVCDFKNRIERDK